jgi:hypothetical protein
MCTVLLPPRVKPMQLNNDDDDDDDNNNNNNNAGTYYCQRLSQTQGHSAAEVLCQ